MKFPVSPANEIARLAELKALEVLDTAEEPAFDRLAALAAQIAGTPIALVSLVDEHRQWFKAHHGLAARHTSRDVSFCGHVVADGEPVVVPDALDDPRFADNPLATGDPFVRFYAGMPLRTTRGHVLGTLCAIDHQPRHLTQEQLEKLRLLADIVVDQLEAHRTRRQAAAHAARLAAVFDVMAEGVVVQDASGHITSSNGCAAEILGLTDDQLFGRTSFDPRWQAVRADRTPLPGNEHPSMVALQTGKPQRNQIMGIHKPDGSLAWLSVNSTPRTEGGIVFEAVTTFHDITETRLTMEHAQQHERLATVGTLAAGVGHEVNNPLAFVLGNIEFAIEELRLVSGPSPSSRMKELLTVLSEAREGADRIRRIVRGLRSLAREDVEVRTVEVSTIVDSALSMAAHETRRRATVIVRGTKGVTVRSEEARLTQVLVNLVVNAAQSFEDDAPSRNLIEVTATTHDDRVLIDVRDNGRGISPDAVGRIFDPFFTTKPIGVGTGLGLSVSRNIMTFLDGDLQLLATSNNGTTFRIVLPRDDQAEPETLPEQKPARPTVLIIDDEPAVAQTMQRILSRDYSAHICTDPREALPLLLSNNYDAIICDMMMPYISGNGIYNDVTSRAPEQAARFIFASGGTTSRDASVFLESTPNRCIEKPFTTDELRSTVAAVVAAKAG